LLNVGHVIDEGIFYHVLNLGVKIHNVSILGREMCRRVACIMHKNIKKETNLRQTYNLFGYNVSNHPIF
jgi:hypothetical protein